MIIALTGMEGNGAVSDLAEQLAMLRCSAGSKVLLVSDPRAEGMAPNAAHYDDIVIDASGCGAGADAAALDGAGVIVALIRPAELEQRNHTALQQRLRQAQAANPGARVLVAVGHSSAPLSPHQVGCILVFVAQIASARLADTLVLDEHGAYHPRHSELELDAYKTEDALCAPEVRHLYRQVFRGAAMA
jgi:hypothetical protein